ncbi:MULTISPECIES: phosphoadenosine phosphosulfate reductase [unclassified Moritella]|uniref:phosphoadenosine phosphosulfate reductase n=1 Tax=unclassified Moritella TaxID=2637987 RepID=UPI001BA69F41|nr:MULTISPECIES: phosphoadenosine phosphosulfate reductase [unclassified Moritella]QUM86557.1 phosphoadenosine phosphosulfate reductase [Moritella sp. 28]QUM90783.1 phosphoadenosine phosphosulfate reductase [Moritella sp. 36]
MNEILELQTNQVSFISGLMAGFSLSIAAQIIRSHRKSIYSTITLLMFTLTSLLFVVALYIDVRLSIEVATITAFSVPVLEQISQVRAIGTTSASIALFLFIIAIGMLTWLQGKVAGIYGTLLAFITMMLVIIAKYKIDAIAQLLHK